MDNLEQKLELNMLDRYLDTEQQLAELLGWTQIQRGISVLFGHPASGPAADGKRIRIPRWFLDRAAVFSLMAEHAIDVKNVKGVVSAWGHRAGRYVRLATTPVAEHASKDFAYTYVVLAGVAALLDPIERIERETESTDGQE